MVSPPALRAGLLENGCYSGMFVGSGIRSTPPLDIEWNSRYDGMFSNCRFLQYIKFAAKIGSYYVPSADEPAFEWLRSFKPYG